MEEVSWANLSSVRVCLPIDACWYNVVSILVQNADKSWCHHLCILLCQLDSPSVISSQKKPLPSGGPISSWQIMSTSPPRLLCWAFRQLDKPPVQPRLPVGHFHSESAVPLAQLCSNPLLGLCKKIPTAPPCLLRGALRQLVKLMTSPHSSWVDFFVTFCLTIPCPRYLFSADPTFPRDGVIPERATIRKFQLEPMEESASDTEATPELSFRALKEDCQALGGEDDNPRLI